MERKEFLLTCGYACMGGLLASAMTACKGTKLIGGDIAGSDLVLSTSAFQKKDQSFRKYLVVHNEALDYPICVYRFSESDYSALLMKCPHQGAELQVFGDRLECPAHGSEFNDHGVVQTGPADTNLRAFPVTVQNDKIKISLK